MEPVYNGIDFFMEKQFFYKTKHLFFVPLKRIDTHHGTFGFNIIVIYNNDIETNKLFESFTTLERCCKKKGRVKFSLLMTIIIADILLQLKVKLTALLTLLYNSLGHGSKMNVNDYISPNSSKIEQLPVYNAGIPSYGRPCSVLFFHRKEFRRKRDSVFYSTTSIIIFIYFLIKHHLNEAFVYKFGAYLLAIYLSSVFMNIISLNLCILCSSLMLCIVYANTVTEDTYSLCDKKLCNNCCDRAGAKVKPEGLLVIGDFKRSTIQLDRVYESIDLAMTT